MKRVELYQKVRRAVLIDGMSRRAAARYFGINRKTVDKMLCFPEPEAHGRSGQTYSCRFPLRSDPVFPSRIDPGDGMSRRAGFGSSW